MAVQIRNADLLLVNRDSKSYAITGEQFKKEFGSFFVDDKDPPIIDYVIIEENIGNDPSFRFQGQHFDVETTMVDEGKPVADYQLKAQVGTELWADYAISDKIIDVEGGGIKTCETDTIESVDSVSTDTHYDQQMTASASTNVIADPNTITGWIDTTLNDTNLTGDASVIFARFSNPTVAVFSKITAGCGAGATHYLVYWDDNTSEWVVDTKYVGALCQGSLNDSVVGKSVETTWALFRPNPDPGLADGERFSSTRSFNFQSSTDLTTPNWGFVYDSQFTPTTLTFPTSNGFDCFEPGDVVQGIDSNGTYKTYSFPTNTQPPVDAKSTWTLIEETSISAGPQLAQNYFGFIYELDVPVSELHLGFIPDNQANLVLKLWGSNDATNWTTLDCINTGTSGSGVYADSGSTPYKYFCFAKISEAGETGLCSNGTNTVTVSMRNTSYGILTNQNPAVKVISKTDKAPWQIVVDGGDWQASTPEPGVNKSEVWSSKWSGLGTLLGSIPSDRTKVPFNGDIEISSSSRLEVTEVYGDDVVEFKFSTDGVYPIEVLIGRRDNAANPFFNSLEIPVDSSASIDDAEWVSLGNTIKGENVFSVTATKGFSSANNTDIFGFKIGGDLLVDPAGDTKLVKETPYDTKLTVDSDKDLEFLAGGLVMSDGEGGTPYAQTPYKLVTTDIESVSGEAVTYPGFYGCTFAPKPVTGTVTVTLTRYTSSGYNQTALVLDQTDTWRQVSPDTSPGQATDDITSLLASLGVTSIQGLAVTGNRPEPPNGSGTNVATLALSNFVINGVDISGSNTTIISTIGKPTVVNPDLYTWDLFMSVGQPAIGEGSESSVISDLTLTFPGDVSTNPDLQYFRQGDVVQGGATVVVTGTDIASATSVGDPFAAASGYIYYYKSSQASITCTYKEPVDFSSITKFSGGAYTINVPYTIQFTDQNGAVTQGSGTTTSSYAVADIPVTPPALVKSFTIIGDDGYAFQGFYDGSESFVATGSSGAVPVSVIKTDLVNNTMVVDGGEWDTSNQSQVWSDLVVGSLDANYGSGDAATAFNGDIGETPDQGLRPASGSGGNDPSGTYLSMNFGTTFQNATKVKLYGYVSLMGDNNINLRINGSPVTWNQSSAGPSVFASSEFTVSGFTTLEWSYQYTSASGYLYLTAIEVDGKLLVDAVNDSQVWSNPSDWTVVNIESGSVEDLFNGNVTEGPVFPDDGSAEWTIPSSYDIKGSLKVTAFVGNNDDSLPQFFYNGVWNVPIEPNAGATGADYTWETGSSIVTGFKYAGSAGASPGVYAIYENGKLLVDAGTAGLGDTHVEYQTKGGQGDLVSVNTDDNTILLTDTGDRDNRWIAENKADTDFFAAGGQTILNDVKLNCDMRIENGIAVVVDLTFDEVPYLNIPDKHYTIKFQESYGGVFTDTLLPDPSSIQATVRAFNPSGEDEATSTDRDGNDWLIPGVTSLPFLFNNNPSHVEYFNAIDSVISAYRSDFVDNTRIVDTNYNEIITEGEAIRRYNTHLPDGLHLAELIDNHPEYPVTDVVKFRGKYRAVHDVTDDLTDIATKIEELENQVEYTIGTTALVPTGGSLSSISVGQTRYIACTTSGDAPSELLTYDWTIPAFCTELPSNSADLKYIRVDSAGIGTIRCTVSSSDTSVTDSPKSAAAAITAVN